MCYIIYDIYIKGEFKMPRPIDKDKPTLKKLSLNMLPSTYINLKIAGLTKAKAVGKPIYHYKVLDDAINLYCKHNKITIPK